MIIGIIGSMQFAEEMLEYKRKLELMGHSAITSGFVDSFIDKNEEEKEKIKIEQKNNDDAMKRDIERMRNADGFLVLNFDKHGINNYIGGNAFLEMGFAYVDNKKIYLLNPIPEIAVFKTEIEAMKPIIINDDLAKII